MTSLFFALIGNYDARVLIPGCCMLLCDCVLCDSCCDMRHVIRFLDDALSSVLYESEYMNDDVVLISIPAGLISS